MGEQLQFVPYEGPEPYIFVSYPRMEKERVFPLLNALRDRGYRIWRDEGGISPGSRWRKDIADHLNRAAGYLVFWSKAAAASKHCYAEINSIIDFEDKEIVTVFLDNTPVTSELWLYLKVYQTVDLTNSDSDATFAESLDRQSVFASCKDAHSLHPVYQSSHVLQIPWWMNSGEILWYLNKDGVLTIAKDEDLQDRSSVPIPDYNWDNDTKRSTAPWMRSRKEIHSVIIWDNIDRIGKRAFSGCKGLTSVTIPDSTTTIGCYAFYGCTGLTNVIIPDGVTTIDNWAFQGCTGLTSVTIPDSVNTIGEFAFWDCTGLTGVTIPDGVTIIRDSAFRRCTGLTSVTIPNGVTSIGYCAFRDCSGLTSVTIPDTVTTIGDLAFQGCSSLTSVSIPAKTAYNEDEKFRSFPAHTQIIRRQPDGES